MAIESRWFELNIVNLGGNIDENTHSFIIGILRNSGITGIKMNGVYQYDWNVFSELNMLEKRFVNLSGESQKLDNLQTYYAFKQDAFILESGGYIRVIGPELWNNDDSQYVS